MSNPAHSNIRPDCKLEYAWRDIQEAQKTGFEECKRKILVILNNNKRDCIKNNEWLEYIRISVIEEIEKL